MQVLTASVAFGNDHSLFLLRGHLMESLMFLFPSRRGNLEWFPEVYLVSVGRSPDTGCRSSNT